MKFSPYVFSSVPKLPLSLFCIPSARPHETHPVDVLDETIREFYHHSIELLLIDARLTRRALATHSINQRI